MEVVYLNEVAYQQRRTGNRGSRFGLLGNAYKSGDEREALINDVTRAMS